MFNYSKILLVFAGSFVLLALISGLRPIGLDKDSLNYVGVLHVSLVDANFIDKEPFFWLIVELNNFLFLGNPVSFFLVFAFIGVFVKLFAIYKISKKPYTSIALYILLYFILHEMTQIRAGIAAGLFLLAVDDLDKNKTTLYILKVLIGVFFHYSAILCLLFLFLKREKFNPHLYLVIIIGSIGSGILIGENFLDSIIPLLPEFLGVKLSLYLQFLREGEQSELNSVNYYYISILIFSLFLIYNYQKIKDSVDLLLIKIFIIGVSSFYLLSFFPVLAFRVSEFFLVVLIVLLPNISSIFKEKFVYVVFIISWATLFFISQGLLKNLNFKVLF